MATQAAQHGFSLVPAHVPSVAGSHRRRDYYLRRALALADVSALLLGITIAGATAEISPTHQLALVASLPLWLMLFASYGLYGRDIRRISHSTIDDLPGMFHALLVGACVMWGVFAVAPGGKLTFEPILVMVLVAACAMLVLRRLARGTIRRWMGPELVLIVGAGPAAVALVHKMQNFPELGLRPTGLVTRPQEAPNDLLGVPLLGGLGEPRVDDLLATLPIDRVLLSGGSVGEEPVLHLLRRCKQLSIKVSLLPAVFDAMGPGVEVDDLGGITVLGINPPVLSRSSRFAKRAVDLIGATVLLALCLPVMLAVALAIKIDSPGPVFFRQQRVGRGGRHFRLLKFRSMCIDAEERRTALLAQSKDSRWLHVDNDPRITRVGRFLRRSSLDELPQLWNVLLGDMSLVGPRPLIDEEDRQVDGWRRARLDLTPGMTGLWQVLGRTAIPFDEMVKLDYMYVTNWSLWSDFRLMLRTIPVVLRRQGVN